MAVNNQDRPSTSTSHIGSQMETNEDTLVSNYDQPWTKNETYQTGNAKFFIHGQDYELKWFMLFAWKDKKYLVDFRLASEMSDADKFDDLVFRYVENGKIMYRFLQAKHSKFSDDKINVKDLKFSFDRNDYSLQKYFKSYLKIVYNKIFQDGDIQDLIICTNLNFYFEPSKRNGAEPAQKATKSSEENETWRGYFTEKKVRDPILNIGGKLYEFSKDSSKRRQAITVLKPIFKKALTYKPTNSKVNFLGELSKLAGVKDKKKLSDDCMEKIDEFLDKLVFAVGQPSGERLERIIRDKIGGEFNLITEITYNAFFKSMYDWKQHCISEKINSEENSDAPRKRQKNIHKAYYLSHEDLKEIFQKGKSMLAGLGMVTLNLLCQSKLQEYGIRFKDENKEILGVKKFLESKKEQILIMYHRSSALLSVIKVYQILEANKFKLDQYIFSDLKYLSHLKGSVKDPRGAFKDSTRNLLIIECNAKGKQNILKGFFKILEQNTNKQIILIISEEKKERFEEELDDWLYELSFDKETKCTELIDCGNNLTDLTGKVQEVLLNEGIVIFQGRKVGLRTLIKDKQLISGEVLGKIINKEDILIGREFIDSKYNEIKEYFFERTLTRCINVEENILKENKKFIVINGSDESVSYPEYNQDILLISHGEDFLKLCDKYRNHNVHRLRKEGNKLLWQQSHGNVQMLREFINKNVKDTTYKLKFIQDKVVIISGEAGEGKSMLLSHVAHQKKSSDTSIWVVRINLADYATAVCQMKKVNLETVVKFLYKVAGFKHFLKKNNETDEENNSLEDIIRTFTVKDTEICVGQCVGEIDDLSLLEVKLFNEFYKHGKLMLLFDGFDEISPDYEVKVKELLMVLKSTRVKIWITTRQYNIYEGLENELGVISYLLEPFSEEEHERYLKRFWKTPVDDERSKIFVDELLVRFAKFTRDKKRNFVSKPLQLNMLAVIFKDVFKEWYGSGEPELSEKYKQKLNQQLTLSSLYKKFVHHKYFKIRFKEKSPKMNADVPDTKNLLKIGYHQCLEDHRKLAVYAILGENQVGVFLSDKELKKIRGKVEEIKRASEKTGIITHIVNNKPVFVHRTFAEYFLVDLIYKRLVSGSEADKKIWDFLFRQILIKDEYYVTRRFFNCKLSDGLLYSSVNGDPDKSRSIKELLKGIADDIIAPPKPCSLPALNINSIINTIDFPKNRTEDYSNLLPEDTISWCSPAALNDVSLFNTIDFVQNQTDYMDLKGVSSSFGMTNSTPLQVASREGLEEIVKFLLEYLPDDILQIVEANSFIEDIQVYLSSLEDQSNCKCKNYLSDRLNNFVNIGDSEGRTALFYAVINGHAEITRRLLDEGASIVLRSSELTFRILDTSSEIFQILFDHIKIHELNELYFNKKLGFFQESLLHSFVELDRRDLVNILITGGINVNMTDLDGRTALHLAAENDLVDMARILMENRADVNAADNYRRTPLHFAAQFNNEKLIQTLMDNGAHLKVQDILGQTLLHLAVLYRNFELVKTLIDKGAYVNAKDRVGFTPLHLSVVNYSHYAVLISGTDYENLYGNYYFKQWMPEKYNFEIVEILVNKGADVNAKDRHGFTPLDIALVTGELDLIQMLYSKDPKGDIYTRLFLAIRSNDISDELLRDVNVRNSKGMTPLHLAVKYNHADILRSLVQNGADINVKDKYDGLTPLQHAIMNNYVEIVRTLVENGANVNLGADNETGWTPLHLAAKYNNIEAIHMLVHAGANVNARNSSDSATPLKCTAQYDSREACRTLIEYGADVNDPGNIGSLTPLHSAVINNNFEIVYMLIEKGANVDICADTKLGYTSLYSAASQDNEDKIRILIGKGANVNAINNWDGQSAIISAAKYNYFESVYTLIESGATLCGCNSKDQTVLHFIALHRNVELVKTLLDYGADVNVQDEAGFTPLHLSVVNREHYKRLIRETDLENLFKKYYGDNYYTLKFNLSIVEMLVNKGADVNAKDRNGFTALDVAFISDNFEVIEIIFSKDPEGDFYPRLYQALRTHNMTDELLSAVNDRNSKGMTPLHLAAKYNHAEVVCFLVENGGDINAKDMYDGLTPLHYAAMNNHVKVVRTLIENGANVNLGGDNVIGFTPLHSAAKYNNAEVVRILLNSGANVNAINECDGQSAIIYAAKDNHEKVVRTLIENGANFSRCNSKGQTVLHFAALHRNVDLVESLVEFGVDVNVQDEAGFTPLHLSIISFISYLRFIEGTDFENLFENFYDNIKHSIKTNLAVVEMLVNNGADVNAEDRNGITALDIALISAELDFIQMLYTKNPKGDVYTRLYLAIMSNDMSDELLRDVNVRNSKGMTPLHLAVKYRHAEILCSLIENGADINAKDMYNGLTPLHYAAMKGDETVVRTLLENGANVNLGGDTEIGWTPLHSAVKYHNINVVRMLVHAGAKVNARNSSDGATPLNYAAQYDNVEACRTLIEYGADFSGNNNKGQTVLHFAALHRNVELVKTLLDNGVDVNVQDEAGFTPLHLSVVNREHYERLISETDFENLLEKYYGDIDHITESNLNFIEMLVNKGADVNAKDRNGFTPFDIALVTEDLDVIEMLDRKERVKISD